MDKQVERKRKQLAMLIAGSKRNVERAKHEIAKRHLEVEDFEASIEGEQMQQEEFNEILESIDNGEESPDNIMEGVFGVDFNISDD